MILHNNHKLDASSVKNNAFCEVWKAGETVIVWGGVVLTKEDLEAGNYRKGTLSAIAECVFGFPD